MQEERMKLLLDFLVQEPEDPFNRYAVAMELMKSDKQRAVEHLEVLIREHATYLPTYYQLAQLYFDEDALEDAEKIYLKGIALAESQNNQKIEAELRGAYRMLLDDMEEY
ncbi:MAG: tetratricopeptide (TPR) repeat protein [Algoriphagus sp.]|jgi:tetratricopeptide (TPR) repeat protein